MEEVKMEKLKKVEKILEILKAHRGFGEVSDEWLARRIIDAIYEEKGWVQTWGEDDE